MGGKFRGRHKRVEPVGELVAERELRSAKGAVVKAKIYVAKTPEYPFVCTYTVTGDGKPFSYVLDDAYTPTLMQLGFAWQFLRCDVKEKERQFDFPSGVPGASGLEWAHVDPDMNALCARISDLEYCANFALYEAVHPVPLLDEDEEADLLAELSAAARLRYKIQGRVAEFAREGRRDSPLFQHDFARVIPMDKPASLKPPLASDILLRRDTGTEVKIELWAPRRNDEDSTTPWICEFRITGLDQTVQAAGWDVDSLGALSAALKAIGDELEKSSSWLSYPSDAGLWQAEADFQGRLNWYGRHGKYNETNLQISHLMAVEVHRNRLLYDELHAGTTPDPADEEAILEHLAAAQRIRFQRQRKWIDLEHRSRVQAYYNLRVMPDEI